MYIAFHAILFGFIRFHLIVLRKVSAGLTVCLGIGIVLQLAVSFSQCQTHYFCNNYHFVAWCYQIYHQQHINFKLFEWWTQNIITVLYCSFACCASLLVPVDHTTYHVSSLLNNGKIRTKINILSTYIWNILFFALIEC